MQKNLRGRLPSLQPGLRMQKRIGEIVLDVNAGAGKRDGGRDKLGQREFARSIIAQGERQAGDGSRHADGKAGIARFRGDRLARLVEKDVARRIGRRGFAVVDGDGFLLLGKIDEHEAAAAEVSRAWQCHGKGKADGDRGIDRVAAATENVDRRFSPRFLLARRPCHGSPAPAKRARRAK